MSVVKAQEVQPATTASTPITFTVSATVIGNLMIIGFGNTASTTNVITALSGGGTWAQAVGSHVVENCEIWWAICTSSVTSISVTPTTGSLNNRLEFGEFSTPNGWQTSAASTSGSNSGSGSSTPTTATITPAENNDLVIGVHCRNGRGPTSSPAAPWVNFVDNGAAACVALAYQELAVAAAVHADWVVNGGTNWEAEIAAFKESTVTPSNVTSSSFLQLMGVGI